MRKKRTPALIWSAFWLFGNLMSHVSAQDAASAEQNYAAEYVTTTEQSWRESAFYRTIVENNIFRPLGWTPPKPTPVYRLLGTVISADGTRAQAILQEIAPKRLHFLRVGDSIGDAIVTEILSKEVKLTKAGQRTTLKIGSLQFLSLTRTQGFAASSQSTGQTSVSQTYGSPAYHIKSASKEKRRRLIQQYYRK